MSFGTGYVSRYVIKSNLYKKQTELRLYSPALTAISLSNRPDWPRVNDKIVFSTLSWWTSG